MYGEGKECGIMKKRLLSMVLVLMGGLCMAADDGVWMWYPGEYGIWRGNALQFERLQWGAELPPFWPSYGFYPVVEFSAQFDLAEAERVEMTADGGFTVNVNGRDCVAPLGRVDVPKGRVTIKVKVGNNLRPPALLVKGKTVKSGAAWKVGWYPDDPAALPVEFDRAFAEAGNKPGDWKLRREPAEPVQVRKLDGGALLADFGRETYGYLVLTDIKGEGAVKIIYAESEKEALDEAPARPQDCMEFVSLGAKDAPKCVWKKGRGFRYVFLRPFEGNLSIGGIAMERELPRASRRGAFRCNDERVNAIWDVAADTLELTCREVFIEGVKRDHWVWSGDAVQSFLMNYYLSGDYEGCRDTLWCVRGKDPVVKHLNGIMDYSFLWFDAVATYVLYSGDQRFLQQAKPRMDSLMRWCQSRLDAKGRPVNQPGDWIFIDWAPEALHNAGGVCAFEMMVYARALETMAMTEPPEQNFTLASVAQKVKSEVKTLFWSEENGCLMHLFKNDGTLDPQVTRYPNIFGLKWDYFNDSERERVLKGVMFNDKVMKIQTPYMRFYELEALCALGMQKQVLGEIRDYWGGMLDLGATSFWELYNPAERGDQHYAMYGRPYGKSLCHAWGASPIYLLGRYFLGVEPTEPGFAAYTVKPVLGGLEWMTGKVPTPTGDIEVTVKDGAVTVKGNGGKGTLVWNGKSVPIPANVTVTVK